ncbi:MAG: Gfo/Idh/MocA family oxidoreductase [Candidatus Methylomirabilota bacterium]
MAEKRTPLGLGIIGSGRIAQAHLKAAANLPEQVRVVAIAGRRREKAEAAAKAYGIPTVHDDYRQLLKNPAVQAVLITTPNDSHAQIACDAARAGKPILVEKPMALDTHSAEAMVRTAEEAGVVLMVAQSRRFSDAVQTMVRRLPEIGEIFRVHIVFCVPFAEPPTDWWRSREKAGGLVIFLQGSHSLDSIFWWLGRTPRQIFAAGARTNPAWEGEDEADILCSFDGGAVATVHLSLSTAPPVHEALVIGRRGQFRLIEKPASGSFENLYRLEKNGEVLLDGLQAPSLYTHQLREFADSVRDGRTPQASGKEILNVMRMLDAARASLAAGQPVAV